MQPYDCVGGKPKHAVTSKLQLVNRNNTFTSCVRLTISILISCILSNDLVIKQLTLVLCV
jgi:hypothetical protein